MNNTQNPLAGLVSVCCGVEHDINAEHSIKNETAIGGCSCCGHYAEFVPADETERVSNCCGAPVLGEVSAMGIGTEMFGRCSCCKEMAEFIFLED